MRTLVRAAFLVSIITLASCAPKDKNAELTEKKTQLEALKKQQADVAGNITKLETEIAKLDTSAKKEEKPKLVTLGTIAPETFTHYIDLQGKIDAVNISYITPRGGGGQVRALYIKKGQSVSKGQLVLKLDDAMSNQSVVAAKQGLETIKTQLGFAQDLYNRQNNLWKQGIGTEVQLITDKNNVDMLQNQLKSAQEQLKLNEQQQGFTSVYSDVSGVAEDVNVREGELFAGAGQIKIVNNTNLKVVTQIPENYLGKVNVGSHIKVTLPDLNKTLDATVTAGGQMIDPNTHSFWVEAQLPTDKDLRPNQIALVQIQDYSVPNAITVPVNVLQNDEKGKFVIVAATENGKTIARKRPVTIGELYGDKLEVKSGLRTGDKIVVDGYQGLYDGQTLITAAL